MIDIPSKLEKFRDENAVKYVRSNECEVMDTFSSHEESYIKGFNDACEHLLPLITSIRNEFDRVLHKYDFID